MACGFARFSRNLLSNLYSLLVIKFASGITIVPLLLFVAPNSHALEKVTLQLKWFHQFQFAGYYAALDQGYYKEVGLDVTIRERDKKSTPIDEVLSGRANYAVSDSSLILHRLNGKPVTVLGAIFQHSPLVLLTRVEDKIFSPFELKGKRVMRQKNIDDASLTAMFHGLGIQDDDVIHVPHSFNDNDLFSKKVDAMAAYSSNQPYLAKEVGVDVRVINPNNYGIDFYGDMLFTSEEEMQAHPERAIRFLQASLKGWKYALENKQDIVNLLLTKYAVERSKQHLLFEANELEKMIIPNLIELGHLNKERFQRIASIYRSEGMAEKGSQLSNIDYRDYLENEKEFPVWALWVLGSFILTIVVIVILIGINRRLNRVITERSDSLQATNKHLEHYIDVVDKFIIISKVDMSGMITEVSDAFCQISQYSRDELIGQHHSIVRHPDNSGSKYEDMWRAVNAGQHWAGEFKNRAKDGAEYWVEANVEPAFDSSGAITGYTSIRTDITDKKRIEILAITDNLTQLNNRVKLDSVLAYEVSRRERSDEVLSIIMVDVDHFKKINDTFGHLVGDKVLREIAEDLKKQVRSIDIVGRWGGEEFIIVCPATDIVGAEELSNKICKSIANKVFLINLSVTASFGVASLLEGEKVVELIQRVDEALYEAKYQGRNQVVTSTSSNKVRLKDSGILTS